MKTAEEIKTYYNTSLKFELEQLDKKLNKVTKRYSFKKFGLVILILLAATIFLFTQLNTNPHYKSDKDLGVKLVALFFFAALVFLILLYVLRHIGFTPIRKEYVSSILNKIIHFVHDKINYFPNQGITKEEFYSTQLFPLSPLSQNTRKFNSFGLITGDLYKVRFKAAYVHTYTLNDSSSEKKDERIHSIHKGLYAVIQIETKFKSPLIIREQDHSLGDKLGQKITEFFGTNISEKFTGQSAMAISKTGNVEFDNLFDSQCIDSDCLTEFSNSPWPALILKMRKDYDMKFDMLFKDNEFHVAIRGLNLSDFGHWKSFVNESESITVIEQFNTFIGLLEEVDRL